MVSRTKGPVGGMVAATSRSEDQPPGGGLDGESTTRKKGPAYLMLKVWPRRFGWLADVQRPVLIRFMALQKKEGREEGRAGIAL